jgi:hypothetical protein
MVAIANVARTGSKDSLGKSLSPSVSGVSMSSGLTPQLQQGTIRATARTRATKQEVAEAFLANLRARKDIDVDQDGFAQAIKDHFEGLPSRQATLSPSPPLRTLAAALLSFYASSHRLSPPPQIRPGRQHRNSGRPQSQAPPRQCPLRPLCRLLPGPPRRRGVGGGQRPQAIVRQPRRGLPRSCKFQSAPRPPPPLFLYPLSTLSHPSHPFPTLCSA